VEEDVAEVVGEAAPERQVLKMMTRQAAKQRSRLAKVKFVLVSGCSQVNLLALPGRLGGGLVPLIFLPHLAELRQGRRGKGGV
jgi:hypothetical protein